MSRFLKNPFGIRFIWRVIPATDVDETSEMVIKQIATKRSKRVLGLKHGLVDSLLGSLFLEVFRMTRLMACDQIP